MNGGKVQAAYMPPIFEKLGLTLPEGWERKVWEAARYEGTLVQKKGRGPGSLEEEETAGLDYTVLAGPDVAEHLPWLWHLYTSPEMVDLVSDWVGEEVMAAHQARPNSCINVNLVRGAGGRYEWHTDGDPYTFLLYATSHDDDEGGELAVKLEGLDGTGHVTRIKTYTGLGILFDGSTIPHAVLPLSRGGDRVSIPMTYLPASYNRERNQGYDHYLFHKAEGEGQ